MSQIPEICYGTIKSCLEKTAHTRSQADDSSQAFAPPHDDGGQNLASQQTVLDARGQGVEALVA